MKTTPATIDHRRFRGDTIVEVIICTALLGLAMAAAFVSVTHSLQIGTDSGNRNRALGFAQQQFEQIKNNQLNAAALAGYTANPGTPFCISPDQLVPLTAQHNGFCQACITDSGQLDSNKPFAESPPTPGCPAADKGIYYTSLTYDPNTHVFTSNSQWASTNGKGTDDATLYYKLPGGTSGSSSDSGSATSQQTHGTQKAQLTYARRWLNTSSNPDSTILGCIWDYGDDGPPDSYVGLDPHCKYGGQIDHSFVYLPYSNYTYPDTRSIPPCIRTFKVVLTMKLTSGTIQSKPLYLTAPHGPAVNNLPACP